MIADRLKCNAVPIQLPIGKEETFKGIIDLIEMNADIYYDEMGKDMRVEAIPADMRDLAEEYHENAHGRRLHVRRLHHGGYAGGQGDRRRSHPRCHPQGLRCQ
jgi:peptide subunit release factor RF-3